MVMPAHSPLTHTVPMGYLTPAEVAKRLRRHVQVVYRWIEEGQFTVINVGTEKRPQYLVDEDDLARWEAERRIPPTEDTDQ